MDMMLFSCLLAGGVGRPLPAMVQEADTGVYTEVAFLFPNLDEAALPFSEVM